MKRGGTSQRKRKYILPDTGKEYVPPPEGHVVWYCKLCRATKMYDASAACKWLIARGKMTDDSCDCLCHGKKAIARSECTCTPCAWLFCQCYCLCDCHFETGWRKEKCNCMPCFPCRMGIPDASKSAPWAECGGQRMCHFGKRCRRKDTCGYKHDLTD